MQTTTNPADVANRLQTYFSKKLLTHAVNELRLNEFGMQADLPQKAGSKTMRFYRPAQASRTGIETLTEGVPQTTYSELTTDYVDVTLLQRGKITKLSDVLQMIDILPFLQMNIQNMGESAALDADSITRDAIIAGMLNSDGYNERFAGVAATGDSSDDFATFNGLSNEAGRISRAFALGCATQLKVNKAPKLKGQYVGIIPPQVVHDFVQDQDVLRAFQNVNTEKLWKGQLGMVDGINYVEATNPFIEAAVYGTENTAGSNYSTIITGRDAYGVAKLAGTTSPWRPRVTILNKADKSDPHNQFTLAGYKVFFNALLLNENFLVVARTKSTFQN
ncbi:MAG: N4-gp56 family major capsid protein [Verrucomicrobiota bacterium]